MNVFDIFKRIKSKRSKKTRNSRMSGVSGTNDGLRSFMLLLLIVGLSAIIGLTLLYAFREAYFMRNNKFVLRDLHIEGGQFLSADVMRDYLRGHLNVKEGSSLFALKLERTRRDLMSDLAIIKEMSIKRTLPDRLEIRIVEREPILRIGYRKASYVVDNEGVVFCRYAGVDHLSAITGLDGVVVEDGKQLSGMAQAAVNLIVALDMLELSMPIVSIDVSRDDYLMLIFTDQRRVKLSWENMEKKGEEALEPLFDRLLKLSRVINSEAGRNIRMFDATVPRRIFAR